MESALIEGSSMRVVNLLPFLIFFILVNSNVVFASNTCASLFDNTNRQYDYYLILESSKEIPHFEAQKILSGRKDLQAKYNLNNKELKELRFLSLVAHKEIDSLLSKATQFLNPVMIVPENATILIRKRRANPAAHLEETIIRIGYQYEFKDSMGHSIPKSVALTRVINLHEFSHLVLEENLKKLPFLEAFRQNATIVRQKRYEELIDRISPELDRIERIDVSLAIIEANAKTNETNRERDELQEERRQIQQSMIPILEQTSALSEMGFKVNDILHPYHELFADLIPVLYFNNRDIVFKALVTKGRESNSTFTSRKFESSKVQPDMDLGFSHVAFRETRAFIGEELFPTAKTVEDRQKIAKIVLMAILEEATLMHQNLEFLLSNKDANQRLIDRIKKIKSEDVVIQ